jgi:tRNA (guanosine-2'-O-)-methyltransferase
MRGVLERRHDDLVVVIENIHDAHNASAILRSCDAFGVGRIALVYTDQEYPEISGGVAAKVQKWLRFDRYDTAEACVTALHSEGIRVLATDLTDQSADYLSVDFHGPTAIVLGNEHSGCSPEMVALADGALIVPMVGFVQSLNVSVAAAVILAEIARQRRNVQPAWTPHKSALIESWVERETSTR